jgi:hypothetical protein
MNRTLIQIVTGLPPQVDGVGDYALTLARVLRTQEDVESQFVVANPGWSGPREIDGFCTAKVAARTPGGLQRAIGEFSNGKCVSPGTPILLHCSLYGLSKRALAMWTVGGLARWRARHPDSTVITMFHELDAKGSLTSSAFWLNPIHRWILRRLAAHSTSRFVSNERYVEGLASIARIPENSIVKQPVISNLGEPRAESLHDARKRQLVVFGLQASRDALFARNGPDLERIASALSICRIVEFGPGIERRQLGSSSVDSLGLLDPSRASEILGESMFGLVALEPSRLAKSGVFAALCAHGVCPVVIGEGDGCADGLVEGIHYLASTRLRQCDAGRIRSMSRAVHAWYGTHTAAIQARRYAEIAHPTDAPSRGAAAQRLA